MQRNIGTIDLVVRALLGTALIAYLAKDGMFMPGSGFSVLVGAYLVGTGIACYDPLYKFLGYTTYGPLDRSI
jgi:hypothetical protein